MKNFARVYSAQPHYLKGHIITVEIDITNGLNSFTIVGLPDKAVDEARDRVGAALKNCNHSSPKHENQKTIISLAPAEIKKEGSFFDLAIAIGYLLATRELSFTTDKKVFVGELALDGSLRPVRGLLPIAQTALAQGFTEIFVPRENAKESAMIEGLDVYPVDTLDELVIHLMHADKPSAGLPEEIDAEALEKTLPLLAPQETTNLEQYTNKKFHTDFSDVRGQETAKRGLEIAAAGGHNCAMTGPPGTGKSMLAKSFAGILPSLERDEILEVTGIHSVVGSRHTICADPPFRAPHHTSSYVSVIGGGTHPKPGEVTLAHRGVLFLDEFPEFDKRVIESLREPLEDRTIRISRAKGSAEFPTNFILVAAMNPCHCGNYGALHKRCICTSAEQARYRKKLSGPIVDRIDIWLTVEHVDYEKLSGENTEQSETSEMIRVRVQQARKRQLARQGKLNSALSVRDLDKRPLDSDVQKLLNDSAEKLKLSPRAYHRVIKLAWTIADLDGSDALGSNHILEALQYRPREN